MDNPEIPNMVQPSAGIHIILPEYYSPRSMGLLDPSTSDGRVIFFLPWEGTHAHIHALKPSHYCVIYLYL